MISGRCAKCQHDDLLRIRGVAGAYGSGNVIPMGWTVFSSVPVTRLVCTRCGFSEEWIESADDLRRLVERYRAEPG
jgi:hypothetical protein